MNYIPFNKPYFTGNETTYIEDAVKRGMISGNGYYTKKCHKFFENKYGFKKVLLTTSCTDALEMCAILANIEIGDEVIMPSFTFVSTALAFVRQGAKIIFADSCPDHPNINSNDIESLITNKTKAIVVVHYAGIACNMDAFMKLAEKHKLIVIEDAAQAIHSFYKGKPLGTIGHLSAFSFHETKNIMSGEGGMIGINDYRFIDRSEIIWEKGTNRAQFFKGQVDKYSWVDIGSSFLPSEITAAFLWSQIENLSKIQKRRIEIWNIYKVNLGSWSKKNNIEIIHIPENATNNAHMFYLVCESEDQRGSIIKHLKREKILAVFHYASLHSSPYYQKRHDGRELPNSDKFTNRLLRLPMYYELDCQKVINKIIKFN